MVPELEEVEGEVERVSEEGSGEESPAVEGVEVGGTDADERKEDAEERVGGAEERKGDTPSASAPITSPSSPLPSAGSALLPKASVVPPRSAVTGDPLAGLTWDQQSKMVQDVASWEFDIFDLHLRASYASLRLVMHAAIDALGLRSPLGLPLARVDACMTHVAKHYSDSVIGHASSNPYHTDIHAADVTQCCFHMLVSHTLFREGFTAREKFALLFGAAIHDFRHKGVSNAFLTNTQHQVAVLYNDRSVLENMSVAEAFHLMRRPEFNLTGEWARASLIKFRKLVVDVVLATDLAMHFDYAGRFKVKHSSLSWEEEGDRHLVMAIILKAADICHPAKPWELHKRWSARITEEFFRQGDRERELGLNVSPLCDRTAVKLPKSQLGFIGFLVKPMFEHLCDMLDTQQYLDYIESNEKEWQRQADEMEAAAAHEAERHSQAQDGNDGAETK
eukprot:CAMPEP_0196790036 /NCGR_PEP_ID=MMETSP1104-20130614/27588_1 /TAXON_ID=33652 /ORGANISM="Cafeteria sp., Strain Caron Lab Isolate" /LENGTH=448 /DNA_ID=CAMNT_0042160401 /DNA_START=1 /DNA_END=1347 /DNA_ORIENTATION=+